MTPARASIPRHAGAFHIMLSAAGRRVALMRLFQQSLIDLGISGRVLATDITAASPAMQLAAERVVVPPYRDPGCLDFLLKLCRDYPLRLIVPTIDPELGFYARHAQRFGDAGCRINISAPQTTDIGGDKQLTFEFLKARGLPTVDQWPLEQAARDCADLSFPVIIKPRYGSASIGVTRAHSAEQVRSRAGEGNLIVQSIAPGHEYTVDVFVDRHGRCRAAVPRHRLETRGGEVSKGMTVRHGPVAQLAKQVAEALPGAYGVLNIQIFHDPQTGQLAVIEINPRFGGGYPLSHQAGAPMARWLLEDVLDLPLTATDESWRPGVVMLRYDQDVFVDRADAGLGGVPHVVP